MRWQADGDARPAPAAPSGRRRRRFLEARRPRISKVNQAREPSRIFRRSKAYLCSENRCENRRDTMDTARQSRNRRSAAVPAAAATPEPACGEFLALSRVRSRCGRDARAPQSSGRARVFHATPALSPSSAPSHSTAPNSPAKLDFPPPRRRRPPHESGPNIPRPSPPPALRPESGRAPLGVRLRRPVFIPSRWSEIWCDWMIAAKATAAGKFIDGRLESAGVWRKAPVSISPPQGRSARFRAGSERAHCGGDAAARKSPDMARGTRFTSGCCFMRTYLRA